MAANNNPKPKTSKSRRNFLKNGLLLGGATSIKPLAPLLPAASPDEPSSGTAAPETLYNGIVLPQAWPPQYEQPKAYDPMPVPYLVHPPSVIPIDVGRQLFVDDFLIEYTDLKRVFHQPVKHLGNPLLSPETLVEKNKGFCPMAAPFSDGCFYDPQDGLFKLWYMAGWFDGTALATSRDGLHWTRPSLDVVTGTNLVIPPRDDFRRDGVSVWLDHEAPHPEERFKMYYYARQGEIGQDLKPVGSFLLTSPDGIHWKWGGKIAPASDNNTFFYNPFRKKWVFTIRKEGRPTPPWSQAPKRSGRARSYWEGARMEDALTGWKESVFWFGADRLDKKKEGYQIGEDPQIYKVDAAGYESLIIGLIQPHYGPSNEVCAQGGYPKLTELQLAFSRDGFHWDRSNRTPFIGGEPDKKGSWERAYIHSIGGVCNIVGDQLYFYYTAFRGNEGNRNPIHHWNGMYAEASMGLAVLRRDGFASMEGAKNGMLLSRPVRFEGAHLFLNSEGQKGAVLVEVCDTDGTALKGYTKEECLPITTNSTKQLVTWQGGDTIARLAGRAVRFRFYVQQAKIYAFWVSRNREGNSGGATAGGGPGLKGTWDNGS